MNPKILQLFQEQYQNVPQQIFNTFIVDDTVGRNFEFRIDYTSRSYVKRLVLNSANGTIYTLNTDFVDDQISKTALFKLDLAEVYTRITKSRIIPITETCV